MLLGHCIVHAQSLRNDVLKADTLLNAKATAQQIGNMAKDAAAPLREVQQLFTDKTPVRLSKVTAEAGYNYLHDTSGQALGMYKNMDGAYNYNVQVQATFMNMPFNVGFKGTNGIYTYDQTPLSSLSKFNFDHEQYMNSIKQKLVEKVNPQLLLDATMKRVKQIEEKYSNALKGELTGIANNYKKEFQSEIKLPDGIADVNTTDVSSLRTKLFSPDVINNYNNSLTRIQQMTQGKDIKQLEKDTLYQKELANVKQYEALEKVYEKVQAWSKRFQGNEEVKKLKENLPFVTGSMKSYLNNPANIQKMASENFSMSSLQRIFMNVTKLDIGQNAVQGGNYSVTDLINTGVNTQVKTPKFGIDAIYGKNNTPNNWLQSGLTSPITNEYTSVAGVKIGSGTNSAIEQSVGLNFFNFKNSPSTKDNPDAYMQSGARKDVVFSIHSGFTISSVHTVEFDVSKSFGSYDNQMNTSGTPVDKSSALNSLMGNNGADNYAVAVDYKGELWQSDVNVYAKKTGLGYNNPGNYLLRRGETQLGLGFARNFLKRKLSVKYSGSYRAQHFDPDKNYLFTSVNNKAQVGYKITRSDKVSVTYQRSDYTNKQPNTASVTGNNVRLQVDGAYRIWYKKKQILNNTSLSQQKMNIPVAGGENFKSNSILLTHTSSLILDKNILSITVLGNKSDSKDYYFNTSMFISEASYSYALDSKTRLTSATGYYSNYGWNRQIGASQQISTTLMDKINADVQVGYKYAVKVIRPELANQLFINASIRYNF